MLYLLSQDEIDVCVTTDITVLDQVTTYHQPERDNEKYRTQ